MRASCFHSTGHFRARSRLSRVLCALSSRTLSSIVYKINTERTKMNSHRLESRTGISSSNFIVVPSCEIRTPYAFAGLLASEVFLVLLVHRKIGTSIRKENFSVNKSDHLTGGREIHRLFRTKIKQGSNSKSFFSSLSLR